jgi:hypothetical protein
MERLLIALAVAAMFCPVLGSPVLQNGGMEDPFDSGVASPWTYYSGGSITGPSPRQAKETSIVHGGASSQKLSGNAGNNAANFGIRQALDASIGDAFTFGGWVWPDSAGAYNETSIRAAWDGGTSALAATMLSNWLPAGSQRQQWHEMALAGGNAVSTTVNLFLHSDRNTSNGSLLTYWDDIVAYHAYVPPAPAAGNPSFTTFDVNVDPGDNAANNFAEYAVTIGGGGYTIGVDWVQPDGTVTGSPAWRIDPIWGTRTVTGLTPDTTYTIQVKARYSFDITQETFLGTGAEIKTLPEPAVAALLGIGALMLRRRRK